MLLSLAVLLAMSARSRTAFAEGFQLNRYDSAPAGNAFFGVPHPWYSSTRYIAVGLTFDYGHNVLLGGRYVADKFFLRTAIVEHQLVGRVELAGSFHDRLQLTASIPVVLLERGTPGYGVAPIDGIAVSDPRYGAYVRIFGQADRSVISLHIGANLWIPVGTNRRHAGDPTVRAAPEVVLAGVLANHFRWAFSSAVHIRGVTNLGIGPASSIGSELQLRAGLAWVDSSRRFHVGPEAWLSTAITGANAFTKQATSLELMAGGQIQISRMFQISAGIGSGVVSTLGIPDVRAIVRLAYAPVLDRRPGDRDGDGIPDAQDICPDASGTSGARGCPDRDNDGVPDAEDLCPGDSTGVHPDRGRSGCPSKDADSDGVPDAEDLCPTQLAGAHPDRSRAGCPAADGDSDGVPDETDQCPEKSAGASPDPKRPGCPGDRDKDGVLDEEDRCPDQAPGKFPDAKRAGCPNDKDSDGIPDAEDACPNLAGGRDPDRRRSGCPKLDETTTELRAVHFDTNEATLLPDSYPVLDETATLLNDRPDVLVVEIAGHADDTGAPAVNLRLSNQRAKAVVRYLVEHGVDRRRLRAVGYGDTKPMINDQTDEARARNRRVEMRVPSRTPTPTKKP